MAQIFLSYSRKDHDEMLAVKKALSGMGARVWTDESMEPGTPVWQRAIEREIAGSSCLVALLSPDAKDSLWVRSEIDRARLLKINIIPVLVRGENDVDILPLGLETANWIDIRKDRAANLARLADTASRLVGATSTGLIDVPEPQVSAAGDEGEINDSYIWNGVGRVLQYYPRVNAVGVELTAMIFIGDLLFFGEGSKGVIQRVESIERDRVPVNFAEAGQQAGIRVWMPVEAGCPVEKAVDAPRASYVGVVNRFYPRLSVAGISLDARIAVNDQIEVRGPTTRFRQVVRSIQIERQRRTSAGAGDDVGVAVVLPASEGDRVYRIS